MNELGGAPGSSEAQTAEAAPEAVPLRLGFARGTAPSKWAQRWRAAGGGPLELVPLAVAFGRGADRDPLAESIPSAVPTVRSATDDSAGAAAGLASPPREEIDVVIERARPGEVPDGSSGPEPIRHAMRLYTEAVALVLPAKHELAEQASASVEDLELVALLDHADHAPEWPAAAPWEDPSWKPADADATLALVATGAGGALLPLPLARHLASKREHAVLPLDAVPPLAGTTVWATWSVGRNAADVQQLAGIMRGRTARSSRPDAETTQDETRAERAAEAEKRRKQHRQQQAAAKKKGPKPGSRGAQLAAAKEKAERAKAAKRAEKRRKRR